MLPTGAVPSRGYGLHQVATSAPPPLMQPGQPIPGDAAEYARYMETILCNVSRKCVYMSAPHPVVHPGLRHEVVPNLCRRDVVIPAGFSLAGTMPDAIAVSALILSAAQGLTTFTIGTSELVTFVVPQGFVGLVRGWSFDVINTSGDGGNDVFVSVVVDGGRRLVPETTTYPGLELRDLSTWGFVKEGQEIKMLARATSAVTPRVVEGCLDIWTWPIERGGVDSLNDLILQAGRRQPSVGFGGLY